MWNISVNRKYLNGGFVTTHVWLASTVPNPSTRKVVWTGTCGFIWASHLLFAGCVAKSIPARISWSITSGNIQATSPSTATSVERVSPSRLSSTSTFVRTTLAVCHWRDRTASPQRPLSPPEAKPRKSLLFGKKLAWLGKLHRDLYRLLGQIESRCPVDLL